MARILVVDDEKPLSHAISIKLKSSGNTVHSAVNGQEALNMIRQDKYDLVLLDIMMPEKNGFEVLQEVSKMKHSPAVIMTTNLSQDKDREQAICLGAKDYLVKSEVSLEELENCIERMLAG